MFAKQRSSKVCEMAWSSRRVSAIVLAKVPESEHLGAGIPRLGTWALESLRGLGEVSECGHLGAGSPRVRTRGRGKPRSISTCARESSECEYLDAGVSAKSHSVVPVEDEAGLLAKQQVNSKPNSR